MKFLCIRVLFIFKMHWKNLKHHDTFCYTCREVTFKSRRLNSTHVTSSFVGYKVVDQDTSRAPQPCCVTCARLLTGWVNGWPRMPFAIPRFGGNRKGHPSGCYFCLTNNRDHLQIQTYSEISRFAICNVACPTKQRDSCTKASGKSHF